MTSFTSLFLVLYIGFRLNASWLYWVVMLLAFLADVFGELHAAKKQRLRDNLL